jgi:hypothetical protein
MPYSSLEKNLKEQYIQGLTHIMDEAFSFAVATQIRLDVKLPVASRIFF